jgi:hypothetical protein
MILATMVAAALLDPKHKGGPSKDTFEEVIRNLRENDPGESIPTWESIVELIKFYLDLLEIPPEDQWRDAMMKHLVSSRGFWVPIGGTKIFSTSKDHMGIGHLSIQEGDKVWICSHSRSPLILRKLPNDKYRFMGEAYIHAIMFGEVAESELRSYKTSELFSIILERYYKTDHILESSSLELIHPSPDWSPYQPDPTPPWELPPLGRS